MRRLVAPSEIVKRTRPRICDGRAGACPSLPEAEISVTGVASRCRTSCPLPLAVTGISPFLDPALDVVGDGFKVWDEPSDDD